MMNLDKLDPDWELARRHGEASKLGTLPQKNSQRHREILVCRCCFEPVMKEPVSFCSNSKELQFLGFGYPLFYIFLQNCIMMLFMSICVYAGFALRRAIILNFDFCTTKTKMSEEPFCSSWMINLALLKFSDSRDQNDEEVLRVFGFVSHWLFLIYMRDNLMKLQAYYDEKTTSLSDYTVMIKNFPSVSQPQKKLKRFFDTAFEKPHAMQKLILVPEYKQIEELEKEKGSLVNQLRKFYKRKDFNQKIEEFVGIKKQVKTIERKIQREIERSRGAYERDEIIAKRVIISFESEVEKDQVLNEVRGCEKAKLTEIFGKDCHYFSMKEAPDPKEIIWENIGLSRREKIVKYIIGWSLSIALLLMATLCAYGILKSKASYLHHAEVEIIHHPQDEKAKYYYKRAQVLVYVVLFLIVLFNKFVMANLFHIFTDLQRHNTNSKFQFSFCLKYCLGLFFTTALMTMIVEAVQLHNYYAHPYGVIEEETIMFFINAFFVPAFWLVNPFYLKRLMKRCLNVGKRHLTQGEANILMEDPGYDMGKRYAEIVQTLWFTFFYITLIPIGTVISCVGIILYYWIDKYNLIRKSKVEGEISGKLIFTGLTLVEFTLVLRAAGQVIFDLHMRHHFKLVSAILLAISLLYFLIPKSWLINSLHPQQFNPQSKKFSQIRSSFQSTYMSSHPILREMKISKTKERMKRLGYIFEDPSSSKYSGDADVDDAGDDYNDDNDYNDYNDYNEIQLDEDVPQSSKNLNTQAKF